MRKVLSALFFTLVLLFSTICFAGNDDYPRVAVLDFTNKAKANKSVVLDKESLKILPEFVISALLETGKFNVIDLYFDSLEIYAQLYNVDIKELKKDRNKNRIANLLGVKYLIDGAVTKITNNNADDHAGKEEPHRAVHSQPAEYKVVLQVRFTDTKTQKVFLVAEGYGLKAAENKSGNLSAIEIQEVLYAAVKDAINGKNGVLAIMNDKKTDKNKQKQKSN